MAVTSRQIQLYASGTATATSVAQVTIPSSVTLKGAVVALYVDSVTDNGFVRVELSKVPTNQIATNGALDPFLEFGSYTNFVTSGLNGTQLLQFIPLAVHCRQGEIVYLHATVSGTAQYYANVIFTW